MITHINQNKKMLFFYVKKKKNKNFHQKLFWIAI